MGITGNEIAIDENGLYIENDTEVQLTNKTNRSIIDALFLNKNGDTLNFLNVDTDEDFRLELHTASFDNYKITIYTGGNS
jgi:hypothetical protein